MLIVFGWENLSKKQYICVWKADRYIRIGQVMGYNPACLVWMFVMIHYKGNSDRLMPLFNG